MSRAILPEPTDELKKLSTELCARIQHSIKSSGFLSFSQYMEAALYEPGMGYYSAGLHKLGASGDFVTAPELGSLFATCLARQVEQIGAELGCYEVLEIGAGNGKMAADLLQQIDPAIAPLRYRILERSADLRAVQQQTLQQRVPQWMDRIQWLDAPPAQDWQGVLLANEVIDAMAVERFRLGSGIVEQAGVTYTGRADGEKPVFSWCFQPAGDDLKAKVLSLGLDPQLEYESEILLGLEDWLNAVSSRLTRGCALFIDYGYPRKEYYLPERRQGTLICNYRHRAHDDVFFWPGLQDITSFVDFTALAEAGEACGLELSGYTNQAMFLMGCGLDEVLTSRLNQEPDHGLAMHAEAKQLTLPGMMGERFQVMALSRGLEMELRGFSIRDLSYRL